MIFLIFLYLIFPIYGEVSFTPHEQRQYVPGDFIKGTLKFDPKFDMEVSQLKGKNFLGYFFVADVGLVENSKAEVTLIPTKNLDPNIPHNWLGEPVNLSALSLGQSSVQPKSFIILSQEVKWPFIENPLLWVFSALLLIGLGVYLWIRRKNKLKLLNLKLQRERLISKWREKIKVAAKREDFELIFHRRKEWISLINPDPKIFEEFFKTLDKHQYKKNWIETDLKEVTDSYSRFKNGI